MSIRAIVGALLLSFAIASNAAARPIPRSQLEEMFASIKAQTSWDLSRDMLWGFYFLDRKKEPLEKAAKALAAQGYRVVEIRLRNKSYADEPDVWQLHVERVETLSVSGLDTRNTEFNKFAKEQGIQDYDGMDVGPAP
jgi:hypothetical protein